MDRFRRVSNGTDASKSPARSAAWLNAVSQTAEHFQQQVANGQAGAGDSTRHGLVNPVKVKNLTDANRVRGDVVQIGDYLLTPFDPRNPWFQGTVYDAAEPRPIAIIVKAAEEDDIVEVAITGVCVARVDVQSTSDRYAAPEDGQTVLKSSSTAGAIEILSPLTTTGVQEAFVLIGGGGSGDPIAYGQLINSVPANSTLESCIRKETFDTWFSLVYDPPESEDIEDVVLLHAGNPSLNSEYRGSTDEPIRVWGVMRTTEVSVDSELVMVSTFIIHGEFKDQVAASAGFVKSPDNDKGQAMMHTDGSAATVVDGGPCGGA